MAVIRSSGHGRPAPRPRPVPFRPATPDRVRAILAATPDRVTAVAIHRGATVAPRAVSDADAAAVAPRSDQTRSSDLPAVVHALRGAGVSLPLPAGATIDRDGGTVLASDRVTWETPDGRTIAASLPRLVGTTDPACSALADAAGIRGKRTARRSPRMTIRTATPEEVAAVIASAPDRPDAAEVWRDPATGLVAGWSCPAPRFPAPSHDPGPFAPWSDRIVPHPAGVSDPVGPVAFIGTARDRHRGTDGTARDGGRLAVAVPMPTNPDPTQSARDHHAVAGIRGGLLSDRMAPAADPAAWGPDTIARPTIRSTRRTPDTARTPLRWETPDSSTSVPTPSRWEPIGTIAAIVRTDGPRSDPGRTDGATYRGWRRIVGSPGATIRPRTARRSAADAAARNAAAIAADAAAMLAAETIG